MVEEGASDKFDEILIEGGNSISREDLLKHVRSTFGFMLLFVLLMVLWCCSVVVLVVLWCCSFVVL